MKGAMADAFLRATKNGGKKKQNKDIVKTHGQIEDDVDGYYKQRTRDQKKKFPHKEPKEPRQNQKNFNQNKNNKKKAKVTNSSENNVSSAQTSLDRAHEEALLENRKYRQKELEKTFDPAELDRREKYRQDQGKYNEVFGALSEKEVQDRASIIADTREKFGNTKHLSTSKDSVYEAIDRVSARNSGYANMDMHNKTGLVRDELIEMQAAKNFEAARNGSTMNAADSEALYNAERKKIMQGIVEEKRLARQGNTVGAGGAAAPAQSVSSASAGEAVDSSNWSTTDRYMEEKRKKIVNSLNGSLDQGGATDDVINHFSKKLGLKDKSEEFANLVRSEDREKLGSFLESQAGNYRAGANILDSAVAHKVPQVAATGLGTAWLVSNMSANKGQQSNAQLYGQQQPYY